MTWCGQPAGDESWAHQIRPEDRGLPPPVKRHRERERAPAGTSPLEWEGLRALGARLFREWIAEAGLTQLDVSIYLSHPPFQARRGGVKEGWVSQLLTAKLKHAPYPLEVLGIAYLTGNLVHPFLREMSRHLYWRLDLPMAEDLYEEYAEIYGIADRDERLIELTEHFRQLREVMER